MTTAIYKSAPGKSNRGAMEEYHVFGHTLTWRNIVGFAGVLSLVMIGLASCGTSSAPANTTPIKIGVSLSLTGDFSTDGLAFKQGYTLWAKDINAHGGLLGRKVVLDILDDTSSDTQTTTNYQELIATHHDDLIFGPFSTLLTKPASDVAARFKYALVEGAGGAPSVFNRGLTNVFDVSLPVANNLLSVVQLLKSLPAGTGPKTVGYATSDDPFTQPQVDIVKTQLEAQGLSSVTPETVFPDETTDFTPIAQKLIQAHADVVVLGTTTSEQATSILLAFKQQHYTPKAIIATAGPDQGATFLGEIGGATEAEGIMVPNGWFPEANNPGNAQMVEEYVAQFGGTFDGISADVAEAYSVGQVTAQAVTKDGNLDQTKLLATLHSDTFTTVQGAVKFDKTGQNTAAQAYLFQWQNDQLVPIFPAGTTGVQTFEYPKPAW
jgi:branched-chain amino acid transport system substrate-binding protein